MCFENRCGCHKRSRCNICDFFNGCGRKRCGCFGDNHGYDRFERCEKFERFDNCGNFHKCHDFDRIGDGRNRGELSRADFHGYFPQATFEKRVTRDCCCCCKR